MRVLLATILFVLSASLGLAQDSTVPVWINCENLHTPWDTTGYKLPDGDWVRMFFRTDSAAVSHYSLDHDSCLSWEQFLQKHPGGKIWIHGGGNQGDYNWEPDTTDYSEEPLGWSMDSVKIFIEVDP